jgi:hypothetical protein
MFKNSGSEPEFLKIFKWRLGWKFYVKASK